MTLNSVEEILDDLRAGRMVIIMDDEDRENEGDLLMAATHIRPEDINFMARYGRGLICLTLTRERCQQLGLRLMSPENDPAYHTNFTISIEAAHGITTGISASDRARTVQAAVAPEARPADLRQPGHIFPVMAQPGGVLTRAGHTEAGCDLVRLAGLEPAAVIVEILNDDGSMARRPDLEGFATEHGLKIGTIADLIHYRMNKEQTTTRLEECQLPTEFGEFRIVVYRDIVEKRLHYALVKGEVSDEPTLVRVHVQNTLCDLFAARTSDCGWPLREALARIGESPAGVVVVLNNAETPEQVVQRMRLYKETPQDRLQRESATELRTYGIGAQILRDLGVKQMRVLSSPRKLSGLSGFDLEVLEYLN